MVKKAFLVGLFGMGLFLTLTSELAFGVSAIVGGTMVLSSLSALGIPIVLPHRNPKIKIIDPKQIRRLAHCDNEMRHIILKQSGRCAAGSGQNSLSM